MDSEPEPPFEAYQGNEPFTFVSYAHLDKKIVYPIIKELYYQGYKIWYDEGIPVSKNWKKTIAVNIDRSTTFLVFISTYIIDSEYVKKEISFALKKKKPFIGIYLEETELPIELDFDITDIQALFKYKMTEESFWKKLIKQLSELIGPPLKQPISPLYSIENEYKDITIEKTVNKTDSLQKVSDVLFSSLKVYNKNLNGINSKSDLIETSDSTPIIIEKELKTLRTYNYNSIKACAFSPDNTKVAAAGNEVIIWDVKTEIEIRRFKWKNSENDWANDFAFSPDWTKMVIACADHTLKLWEVETGAEIRTFIGHSERVDGCDFSPDGKRIISASWDGILKLWDAETGIEIKEFINKESKIAQSTKTYGTVIKTDKKVKIKRPPWRYPQIYGCAFLPDGTKVVSASEDGTLRLWEVETGVEIRTFTGHSDVVQGCAFSPDGTKLVSASWDKTLKLWDVETGAEISTFKGYKTQVYACAFSPDGKLIASGSQQGLELWSVPDKNRLI